MKWAASIGDNTSILVSKLFDRYKVEEQAYKGCMSLLNMENQTGKCVSIGVGSHQSAWL